MLPAHLRSSSITLHNLVHMNTRLLRWILRNVVRCSALSFPVILGAQDPCQGVQGAKERADLLFFGAAGNAQYALCGVVANEDGVNFPLMRVVLRSRAGSEPFTTRHAAGVDASDKPLGPAFSVSFDAVDTFLWISTAGITFVLHDCNNPRHCGDNDDWIGSIGPGPKISRGRCQTATQRGGLESCNLYRALTERMSGDEAVFSEDNGGVVSLTSEHFQKIFRILSEVPSTVQKIVYP